MVVEWTMGTAFERGISGCTGPRGKRACQREGILRKHRSGQDRRSASTATTLATVSSSYRPTVSRQPNTNNMPHRSPSYTLEFVSNSFTPTEIHHPPCSRRRRRQVCLTDPAFPRNRGNHRILVDKLTPTGCR